MRLVWYLILILLVISTVSSYQFNLKWRKILLLSTRIYFSCFLQYVCGFQSVCHKTGDSSHFCHFCLLLLIFTCFYLFLLISTCSELSMYFYLFLPSSTSYFNKLIYSTYLHFFTLISTKFIIPHLVSFHTYTDIWILVLTSWIPASKNFFKNLSHFTV